MQLWQLVSHPGLIDDRGLDAHHSGPIGETVERKVFQVLHITCDDMNYKILTLVGQARVILQQAENAEICSVKRHLWAPMANSIRL